MTEYEYGNIKKNYIMNSICRILLMFVPLIMTPYLSRTLGSAGIGQYAYFFSYATYFTLFSMLGIPNYGNRAIAKASHDKEERSQTFFEIYRVQIIMSICVVLLYGVFVLFFFNDNIIAWILFGYVLACVFDISWLFFGMEQFKVTLTRNLIIKGITIVCVILFIKTNEDVYKYALITSISTLVANIALFPNAKKILKIPQHGIISSRKHVKGILILFIPCLAISIYTIMDKVMLGIMSPMNEVGFYENSERIMNVPLLFVSSLGTVMMPRISNLLSLQEEEKSKDYLYKSIIFIMFLVSAMCFGVVAIAENFVPLFFGPGFEKCVQILTVLMPSCIFLAFANVIRTQYLLPHEMDREYVIALLIGAGVNLVLNLLLIPRYASIGASIGTLVTEAVVCFFQCFSVRKYIPLKKYICRSIPFVIAGVLMSIVVRNVSLSVQNIAIEFAVKILMGIVIYFFPLIVLYCLRKLWGKLK